MAIEKTKILAAALITFLLSGCASLKAPPIPESPQVKLILSSSSAALKVDEKGLYPFNHAWSAGFCAVEPETSVFITPVDTSRVDPAALKQSHLNSDDLFKLAEYARSKLEKAFSKRQQNFRVVTERPAHGRVVELSVVELTGTEVVRNVLGTVAGALVPGGSLFAARSSGTIGVEGVVREADTGKPLFVFSDRERGKTAPFSFNDFRQLSHARAAIDDWSEQLVASCSAAPGSRIADSSPVTLIPL